MRTAVITIIIVILVLLLLYLWAIRTRVQYKKKQKSLLGVDYAHRGLHDNHTAAPENSLPAFRKAVKAGYGIELDVQLSKDGVPVVFHDFTLKRMCDVEGKVCDYTFDELQEFRLAESTEKIPRFDEVLQVVNGRVPLIIELKMDGMDVSVCPVVDKILRHYTGAYCMESFNPLGLIWYRRYHNEVIRGQLSDRFLEEGYHGIIYFCLQNMLFNFLTRPDFIAYNHKYTDCISRRICRKLFRCLSVTWTIRSQDELDHVKDQYDLFIFEHFAPKKNR